MIQQNMLVQTTLLIFIIIFYSFTSGLLQTKQLFFTAKLFTLAREQYIIDYVGNLFHNMLYGSYYGKFSYIISLCASCSNQSSFSLRRSCLHSLQSMIQQNSRPMNFGLFSGVARRPPMRSWTVQTRAVFFLCKSTKVCTLAARYDTINLHGNTNFFSYITYS